MHSNFEWSDKLGMYRHGIPNYPSVSMTTVNTAHSALIGHGLCVYRRFTKDWEEARDRDELDMGPDEGAKVTAGEKHP